MKKLLSVVLFSLLFVAPVSAQASILNDLFGAVKDLQKQVLDLVSLKIDLPKTAKVSTGEENWKTFTDQTMGFEVKFPSDFSTTTLFSITPQFKNADAFVRTSRADFLAKIVKPSSTAIILAVQDSAIFFEQGEDSELYANLAKLGSKVSTSTKEVGSTTVFYILHSTKTDPAKFGGGSTEEYVFGSGSSTIVAEANYAADIPSGQLKTVFDRMLLTFKFTPSELGMASSTASSTIAASSTNATGTSTASTGQAAGAVMSR